RDITRGRIEIDPAEHVSSGLNHFTRGIPLVVAGLVQEPVDLTGRRIGDRVVDVAEMRARVVIKMTIGLRGVDDVRLGVRLPFSDVDPLGGEFPLRESGVELRDDVRRLLPEHGVGVVFAFHDPRFERVDLPNGTVEHRSHDRDRRHAVTPRRGPDLSVGRTLSLVLLCMSTDKSGTRIAPTFTSWLTS